MPKRRLAIAAALAQRPFYGGHAWALLHYFLGFQRLGWDVLFLDILAPELSLDAAGQRVPAAHSQNIRYIEALLERFGITQSYALFDDQGMPILGASPESVRSFLRDAALLINVMGLLRDESLLRLPALRVFLDIDPGFGQMWHELGLHDLFTEHDAFVTVGENIGQPDCLIPTTGIPWLTTCPPVVLPLWPMHPAPDMRKVTAVGSWRGPFGPIEYRGQRYGLRVHEFRQFMTLPHHAAAPLELAFDIHADEVRDLALLREHGWRLVDPKHVAGDPWQYQEYIQTSSAEFLVAKNMYVATRSGWFSDRSVCYLASGRPVLAQDTGYPRHYPTGEGLLAFATLEEAINALTAVFSDFSRHMHAARDIAEEFFDSDKVLSRMLGELQAE